MKWKIHLVAHTHWDKEWYFTKEESDVLLRKNMKDIIQILEDDKNYKAFNFDGQASIIDDYLNFESQDENKIKNLIREGRLKVGPWYTQPDLFNVTSESIVRNLLIGCDTVKKMEGMPLAVAYAPDSFGHNAQMPQIFSGFNLDHFIFWRGMSKEQYKTAGTLFNWEGVDKTKILSYNFYNGYWAMGSFFPYEMNEHSDLKKLAQDFLDNSKEVVDNLKNQMMQKGILLLPLGGDQGPINAMTPQFIATLNNLSEDEWTLSTYEDFFDDLTSKTTANIETISGELKSPFIARIHKTIGSMRYDIKKLLKEVEYKLYRVLEHLAVYFNLRGIEYPFHLIESALKKILISQAHDSAGGCNSDATNENILNRLTQAKDIIESQITMYLKILSHDLGLKDSNFLVFNTNLNEAENFHKVKICTRDKTFQIKNSKNEDVVFQVISQKHYDGGKAVKATASGEVSYQLEGFYEFDVILEAKINPFKYEVFEIEASAEKNNLTISENKITKNNLEISCEKNGQIIFKKENQITNILTISATDDNGDSYDYSPLNEVPSTVCQFNNVEVKSECGPILSTLKMKYSFFIPELIESKNLVEQEIFINCHLRKDGAIFLDVDLINKARNIKWFLNNNLNEKATSSFANQAYSTIERKITLEEQENWQEEGWCEYPASIETNESFVSAKTGNKVLLTYLTKGNNEYELDADNLKITLFRSVDVLGRHDLAWRPGRASGTSEVIVPTPKATLMNERLTFNFEIILGESNSQWRKAFSFTTPTTFYQNQKLNNLYKKMDRFLVNNYPKMATEKNFIENLNPDFVVMSIKKSQNNHGYIVRGFNSTDKVIKLNLMLKNIKQISLVKLNEEVVGQFENNIEVLPNEILSVYFEVE